MYRRATVHSSLVSSMIAPTSRMMALSFGKMPTTSVRRLISRFPRSSGFVEAIWVQCSRGSSRRSARRAANCPGDSLRQERAEPHVGQHVVARGVHEGAELVLLFAECIGDGVPLGFRVGLAFLGEDRLEHRRHGRALLGRGMRQGVAHPVNPTALMGCVEDPARRRPQPLVIIGDDELHATQAAVGQRP